MIGKDASVTFTVSLSALLLLLLDQVFAVPFIVLYALLSISLSDNVSVVRVKSGKDVTVTRWPIKLASLLVLTLAPITYAATEPLVMLAGLVLSLAAWIKASDDDTLQRSRRSELASDGPVG